jgi:hypothetical protein
MSEERRVYLVEKTQEQPLIRNCLFAFRCHQQWKSLEHTSDPDVRYCHECSRQVLLCRSDAELRAALHANECVAIENPASHRMTHTIGVLEPEYDHDS